MFIATTLPMLLVAAAACGGSGDDRETSHGMAKMDDTAAAASPDPIT
jgi:hypothetical protein